METLDKIEQQLGRKIKSFEHYLEAIFVSEDITVNQIDLTTQAVVQTAATVTPADPVVATPAVEEVATPVIADPAPTTEAATVALAEETVKTEEPVVATPAVEAAQTTEVAAAPVEVATPAVDEPAKTEDTVTPAVTADPVTPTVEQTVEAADPVVTAPVVITTPAAAVVAVEAGQVYRSPAKEYFVVEGTAKSVAGEDLVAFTKVGEVVEDGHLYTTFIETLANVNSTFELAFKVEDLQSVIGYPILGENMCQCSGEFASKDPVSDEEAMAAGKYELPCYIKDGVNIGCKEDR